MSHYFKATPVFLSVTLALVSGCSGPEIFDRVSAQESTDVQGTPYPRLSEVTPPAPGPDPATGDSLLIDLSTAASAAETRREGLGDRVQ
ncbi:MAG: hypothetical protein ACPGFA_00485 [Pikeienuella sp.]